MLQQLLLLVEPLKALRGQGSLPRGAPTRGRRPLLAGLRCGGAERLDREEETSVVQAEQAAELGRLWSVRGMLRELAAFDRLGTRWKDGIRDPVWRWIPGHGLVDAVGSQIRGCLIAQELMQVGVEPIVESQVSGGCA
ncbi:hypothetical protein Y717_19270 [Streptomyces scopuliridis RB72]|uniref:Uncharacterized protein n=1 Tax=Streptomyces scopuliridis RB72 TaxID=1440053 RepID=A0A2T7TE28_9ACTN|nr:hypothetical protein Y717_19270 [Streptomyces scopuliridis RB72]